MVTAARRVRAYGPQFAALAVLTFVATLVFTAAPRLTAHATDEGLRGHIAARNPLVRDLTYRYAGDQLGVTGPGDGAAWQDELGAGLPASLTRLVGARWYGTHLAATELTAAGADLHPDRQRLTFGLRTLTGLDAAARLVRGHWPRTRAGGPLEVALSRQVAAQLELSVGARFTIDRANAGSPPLPARLVGIFHPHDPAAEVWRLQPSLLDMPLPDDGPYRAQAVTDLAGMAHAARRAWPLTYEWIFRVDPARLRAADLDTVVRDLAATARQAPLPLTFSSGLARPLAQFADARSANDAAIATVEGGVFAALVGLVCAGAGLLARRRRAERALLRARGASPAGLARRAAAEAVVTVAPAAALGIAAGHLPAGAPAGPPWLAVLAAAIAVLALPLTYAHAGAAADPSGRRRPRAGLRRAVAEGLLLAVTAGGAALLLRGGPQTTALLVAVPVLLAASATAVALRLYPLLLRPATRLAAAGTGPALFLGTARLSRGPQLVLGPAIAVIALATAVGSTAMAGAVDTARDAATDRAVPGDVLVGADPLPADTVAALDRAPGVTATAPIAVFRDRRMGATSVDTVTGPVVVVDAARFDEVVARSGRGRPLPAAMRRAGPCGSGTVPALASPALAAAGGAQGITRVHDRLCRYQIVGVVDWFPTVPPDAAHVLVLPWAAVADGAARPVRPTGVAVAGAGADLDAVPGVRPSGFGSGTEALAAGVVSVTRWTAHRAELERRGVHPILSAALRLGSAAGLALGLLALALLVLGAAAERARLRALLHPLGFTGRQWRLLLAVELGLPLTVVVLTGAAAGVAVPRLLAPALRLESFADGVPVVVAAGPAQLLTALGLLVTVLAAALAAESWGGRRAAAALGQREA